MLIVEMILSVATKLSGLKDSLAKARRDRRDRIAMYLEELSDTVYAVAASLRADQVPHGKCQEMMLYADTLQTTIGDEIGETAAELADKLRRAHEVEMLLSELGTGEERERQLADLERAAALFKSTSVSVKAAA